MTHILTPDGNTVIDALELVCLMIPILTSIISAHSEPEVADLDDTNVRAR